MFGGCREVESICGDTAARTVDLVREPCAGRDGLRCAEQTVVASSSASPHYHCFWACLSLLLHEEHGEVHSGQLIRMVHGLQQKETLRRGWLVFHPSLRRWMEDVPG